LRISLYDYCVENSKTELLAQWDAEANLPMTPETVSYGSKYKAEWQCESGHRWCAQVWSRTTNHSDCPVCAGKTVVSGINDLKTKFPEIASQWHPTKNGELTPEQVSPNTHRKVWWQCEICGHEWQATVKSRAGIQKCGCPVCAGRTVIPGKNDLETEFPEIAREWHPTKNINLTPQKVPSGTTRRVWWLCSICGHEWQTGISARTHGSGCPVCAGKTVIPGQNDLLSRHPKIAKEWSRERNGCLTPDSVTPLSNRSVWWKCENGHEYKAMIASRTSNGTGCPYCANRKVLPGFNDLASQMPKIAAQWHPTLNGTLTPEMVTCGSAKKVWWQCSEGHVWKAAIYSRTGVQKCGCPVCAGRVKKSKPYHYERIISDSEAKNVFEESSLNGFTR